MEDKIIVALDTINKKEALEWVDKLLPIVKIFKVGSVLFTSHGPGIIRDIKKRGGRIFLDLKFHDIPNVAGGALEAGAKLGVELLTVHTLGGEEMLRLCMDSANKIKPRPKILGVTVLTSMEDTSLGKVGIKDNCLDEVKRLALLAKECGLDGVVASAREVRMLREILSSPFLIVTPGIRLKGGESGDQKRTMTPTEAVKAGSDYLVIGRPVIQAKDPLKAVKEILSDIDG